MGVIKRGSSFHTTWLEAYPFDDRLEEIVKLADSESDVTYYE